MAFVAISFASPMEPEVSEMADGDVGADDLVGDEFFLKKFLKHKKYYPVPVYVPPPVYVPRPVYHPVPVYKKKFFKG